MTYATRSEYADRLAIQGGFNRGAQTILALVTGMVAEDSGATWNPLDTEQDWPGSTDYNSAGVKNYADLADGLAATLATLRNGFYGPVLQALQAGDSAAQILTAFGASPWAGEANYLWLDTLPRVQADYGALSAVPVAGSTAEPPPPDPNPPTDNGGNGLYLFLLTDNPANESAAQLTDGFKRRGLDVTSAGQWNDLLSKRNSVASGAYWHLVAELPVETVTAAAEAPAAEPPAAPEGGAEGSPSPV